MRVSRIFLEARFAPGSRVDLDARTAHYVANVLRLRDGDALQVFNGDGGAYQATIVAVSRKAGCIEIDEFVAGDRESALDLHLALGVSRGERMDLAIQKATELGVSRITPLHTARSVTKLSAERAAKRVAHWQQIAVSACEQCGRNLVPTVSPILELPKWLGDAPEGLRLVLSTRASRRLADAGDARVDEVTLLIGAEGGLSEAEVDLATATGFVPVNMGPRILRTETAALTGVALAQNTWGDL